MKSVKDFITETYFKCLGRHPDPGGMRTYTKAIRNGEITRRDLPIILKSSPEYKEKYGG
ncbi:unnamed protein product [marine sediment metagenome]|uniref:DUF4214 domain-containing protein n=1 Tax=marine sediment metagenome TaxID=412755 RepID=X1CDA6_9ZZZZ